MSSKFSFSLPLAVLAVAAIAYTLLLYNGISGFKALPGPLFGGDLYFQLGEINHMYYTSPLEWASSSNGIGSRPAYFIIYGSLVTIFGKIFLLQPIDAMLKFELILPAISLAAFYILFRKLFGNEWISVLGAISAVSYTAFPLLKYTVFTKYVIVPLFIYSLYLFFKNQGLKTSILLGVMYGAMALSHSTAFVFSTGVILCVFAYMLYSDRSSLSLAPAYLSSKKWFAVAFLLGFIIAQIYWFEPIFIYHGKAGLASQLWSTEDMGNPSVQWAFVANTLGTTFFRTYSLFQLAISLLCLAGLAMLAKDIRSLKDYEAFSLIIFAFAFALAFSYFITMPLLNTNFVPGYVQDMYLTLGALMVSLVALKRIMENDSYSKYSQAILAVLFVLLLLDLAGSYSGWKTNLAYYHPENPVPFLYPAFYDSLQQYILKNSDAHDVILTSNEAGFAVNALTGREVMLSRRAQNDPFVDFDRYQIDGAKILYGNNLQEKISLLKKYNVKYIYYDLMWVNLEWHMKDGKIYTYSDPLMAFYSSQNENALAVSGVRYARMTGWVDPAVRNSNVKMYDLLLVTPDNYDSTGKGLWKDDIDHLLTEAWRYDDNGQTVAVLYKVNLPN